MADRPSLTDPFAAFATLPGVPEAVDEARAAVDGLRGHRVLRRSAEKVTAESMLRGAWASAALEGADLPLDVVRRTVRASGHLPEDGGPVVEGALRVAAELGPLQETWRRAPLQVLARLHSLAAAGQVRDDELGRPRPEAAARLASLAALLAQPTTAPALVVSAVVHAEVLSTRAFPVGGGVVARATGRLVLITGGLDPSAVSVPEVGFAELGRAAYDDASAGYAGGGAEGVAGWVRHCAAAVVLGAREGVAVCEAIQRGA
ncbi:MAG: oxidoreductase [Actinomycetes bacterium]